MGLAMAERAGVGLLMGWQIVGRLWDQGRGRGEGS